MPFPGTPQGPVDDAEVDIEDSPRLPSDWSPLEYELLEYADSLPSGFAERIGRELEGQHRRVAQLRSLNSLMLRVLQCEGHAKCSGATSQVPSLSETPRQLQVETRNDCSPKAPAVPKAWREPTGSVCSASSPKEASQRLVLASVSRQLELKVFEVRHAAERELKELARRVRAAEENSFKLRKESCSEDVAGRKKLWEAETKLNRLQNRVQQLETRRRTWARKLRQREEEVRQATISIAEMSAEVNAVRAQAKDFAAAECHEEQLRQMIRDLRQELRLSSKVATSEHAQALSRDMLLGSPSPLRRPGERRRV